MVLHCDYCGAKNDIPEVEANIEELDYNAFLDKEVGQEKTYELRSVKCNGCGATSSVDSTLESHFCPYCSKPLIQDDLHLERVIRPKWLLPFHLNRDQARDIFKAWIKKSFWSPGKLNKAILNFDHFKGIYLPYWTYDTHTRSAYAGQRGTYYYVNETYNATEDGRNVTKTRRARKVRWTNVQGNVQHFFDDVLICASTSIPSNHVEQLAPWDLQKLVPFDEQFLSGFITEKYQVDLKSGFLHAKRIMEPHIHSLAQRDIGGDEQRVVSLQTQYDQVKFKHILLPVYVSAYEFKGKLYNFLINARTGEIQGDKPISKTKIAMAIILGLIVLGLLYMLAQ